jgi:hypothetical protein
MKALKSLVAIMVFASSSVFAQTSDVVDTTSPYKGWQGITVSYNQGTLSLYEGEIDLNGVSLGYQKTFPVSKKLPFYVETGVSINYANGSESLFILDTDGASYGTDLEYTTWGVTVPVNLTYKFSFNEKAHLAPYLGVYFRGNVLGDVELFDESFNLFDQDEVGDLKWDRINYGLQIGAKFMYKKFNFGVNIASDLNEVSEDTKIKNLSISVGLTF